MPKNYRMIKMPTYIGNEFRGIEEVSVSIEAFEAIGKAYAIEHGLKKKTKRPKVKGEEYEYNIREPREEFQPPCFDNFDNRDCDCYEIGEGGCAICVYDCERIIEGEPCHKYKTRGRNKE